MTQTMGNGQAPEISAADLTTFSFQTYDKRSELESFRFKISRALGGILLSQIYPGPLVVLVFNSVVLLLCLFIQDPCDLIAV